MKKLAALPTVHLQNTFKGLSYEDKFAKYRELWAKTSACEVLTDFPLHLDVELSGICNLRCEKCFQNGLITNKLGFMSEALFDTILEEAVPSGLCAMKLQVRGESLLHPQFFDFVKKAKNAGLMDVQVTTNGTLLEKTEICDALLTSGIDGIIFSYDEHHEKAYNEKKTTESTYNTIADSINKFLLLREKRREATLLGSYTDSNNEHQS